MIHVKTEHVKRGRPAPRTVKLSSQQVLKLAAESIEQERRIMAEVYPRTTTRGLESYNAHLR